MALKVFSPEIYFPPRDYELDMARVARVAARVAEIQQDHLLDIRNFIEPDNIMLKRTGNVEKWLLIEVIFAPSLTSPAADTRSAQ